MGLSHALSFATNMVIKRMNEPKFRPGDVVRGLYGIEFAIAGFDAPGRAYASDGRLPHNIRDLTLVYRPPSRAEVEALRKVAEAAEDLLCARSGYEGIEGTHEYAVMQAAVRDWNAITND